MRCSAIYSAELIMDSALAQGLAPLQFRDLFLKLEPLFFAGNRVDDASCREGKVWVLFQYFLPRSVSQLVFLQFLLIRPILTFNEPANPLKYPPFCIEHPWCPGPTCHGWSESTAWPHDMPVWRLPCGTPNRREVPKYVATLHDQTAQELKQTRDGIGWYSGGRKPNDSPVVPSGVKTLEPLFSHHHEGVFLILYPLSYRFGPMLPVHFFGYSGAPSRIRLNEPSSDGHFFGKFRQRFLQSPLNRTAVSELAQDKYYVARSFQLHVYERRNNFTHSSIYLRSDTVRTSTDPRDHP